MFVCCGKLRAMYRKRSGIYRFLGVAMLRLSIHWLLCITTMTMGYYPCDWWGSGAAVALWRQAPTEVVGVAGVVGRHVDDCN